MNLTQVEKLKARSNKRVGQGHGSGRGKTAGRGTKGQKARNKVAIYFEGGALPLTKRLPFLRGKGRNRSLQEKPYVINVHALNVFPKGTIVTTESLVKQGMIALDAIKHSGIKILGNGELDVALTVTLPVSKGAAEKIKNAGGTVES
ncbi:MAG TPA: 50S ribosomal protein L15 [Candidatus Sulfotelmatobacter sp.]|jgi:large subunit ribosomal protein L15|nr:50S ribosomal protein L15 [Candidatus Sulfotelmatobacter sp.]